MRLYRLTGFPTALSISLVLLAVTACLPAPSAIAAAPAPVWTTTSSLSDVAPGDSSGDSGYYIVATNNGAAPTDGSTITITDTLPPGLSLDPAGPHGEETKRNEPLSCSSGPPIVCTDTEAVSPGASLRMWVPVDIAASPPPTFTNQVSIAGGGAPSVSASSQNAPSATLAGFGFQGFDGLTVGPDGSAATQAGSHPYQMTVSFTLNHHFDSNIGVAVPDGDPKNLTVNLPAGVVVNPNATPAKCTESQLESDASCPDSSAAGTITLFLDVLGSNGLGVGAQGFQSSPLYNMVPPAGVPAEFGFSAAGLGIYVHLFGRLRTGADYGLSASVPDILQRGIIVGASTTLWGNPTDPSHDSSRGRCGITGGGQTSCPVTRTNTPFLTQPSACSGPLTSTISSDSWQNPGVFAGSSFLSHDAGGSLVGIEGCEKLSFDPSISVKPDTSLADSPAGLNVDLRVPQDGLVNPTGLAEANLKKVVVTLPVGMSVSPSAANGLGACAPEEIGLSNAEKPSCPDASKVGSVEVITPLLQQPLQGSVYLAQQANNPFGSLIALYLVAEGSGALIKLAGNVSLDPVSGRVTATFDNAPQLPFSDLKLSFFGGPRAALVTPSACGSYTAASRLTPWSSETPAEPGSTFAVSQGCSSPQPFAPSFTAGTLSNQAGAFSPFSVSFSRTDQDQNLSGVTVRTPPGLLGLLKSVERCPEPQASQGACGAGSLIGHTTVAAGPGPDPVTVTGQVFLTGPYKGAPFGLSILVPALAGPFNLGTVVVRASVGVDPHTAQITVVSDPLPTILQGIPLDTQRVNVTVDRSGFMFNPTSCEPMGVGGTLTSTQGASAQVSSRFQAAGCASLGFHPSFTVSTQARTSKAGGASLDVRIGYPSGAQANIHSVAVSLPKQLPSRLTTIQQACPEAVFNANPASCPVGSNIGTATATTPVLANPVVGPAYLVSHGGAAFPDLVVILQGEGVTVDLVGSIDIKHGVTSSTFASVPDVPIGSFDLTLPQGPHSALTVNLPAKAKGSLCGQSLAMPTAITGQNGAVVTQSTKIKVTGCPKAKAKKKHRARHGKRAKKGSRKKGK